MAIGNCFVIRCCDAPRILINDVLVCVKCDYVRGAAEPSLIPNETQHQPISGADADRWVTYRPAPALGTCSCGALLTHPAPADLSRHVRWAVGRRAA
jgi:hypothetical protein